MRPIWSRCHIVEQKEQPNELVFKAMFGSSSQTIPVAVQRILMFKMDILKVSKKLVSGDFKLREQSGSLKSEVWKKFGVIVDSEGNDLQFVGCRDCHHVLNHKGRNSGTTTLKKHQCKMTTGQKLITPSVFVVRKPTTQATTMEHRRSATVSCVDWVCQDLRPFDAVGGKGFLAMIDTVSLPL